MTKQGPLCVSVQGTQAHRFQTQVNRHLALLTFSSSLFFPGITETRIPSILTETL